MKYIKVIRSRFNNPKVPVFKLSELKIIPGISELYLKTLIHNLLANGEIRRITKGIYTFHKDADVLCFAFTPSYYGLEDALSIRHISEQGTNPMVLTQRNVRRGKRKFAGSNYLVYHLKKELFFGYEPIKRGDFWLPVSDVEKTLIDMVYFKINIRDELWENLLHNIKISKLDQYLKKYNPKIGKTIHNLIKEHAIQKTKSLKLHSARPL